MYVIKLGDIMKITTDTGYLTLTYKQEKNDLDL